MTRLDKLYSLCLGLLALFALAVLGVVIFVLESWLWRVLAVLGGGFVVMLGFYAATFYFAGLASGEPAPREEAPPEEPQAWISRTSSSSQRQGIPSNPAMLGSVRPSSPEISSLM